jgi:hypothetical protein
VDCVRVRNVAIALIVGFVPVGVPRAAEAGSTGIVISRLTLRGPVSSDDAFMAYRGSSEPGGIVEPGQFVCGPADAVAFEGLPECTAGTYEVETPPLPVGSTVQYEFRRHPGAGPEYSTSCVGSITVQEQPQTVTCVYEYPRAASLPDVATEARTTPSALLGWLLVLGGAAAWLAVPRRAAATR